MRSHRLLIISLLLAAILRIWGLGDESLWLDEGFTYRRAYVSLPVLIADLKVQTQGIAYYVIERGWCRVFGTSEFALRFPSVIFGTLSVLALYLLAVRFFSRSMASLAALILAVNPFAVFYSQDARPYALFLLAALASLEFFALLLEEWNRRRVAGYLLFTVLALYTHPFAPFLLVAQFAGLLIFRGDESRPEARRNIWQWIALFTVTFVLLIPQLLLVSDSIGKKLSGTGPGSWIPLPSILKLLGTFQHYFMTPYLAATAALTILVGLLLGWRCEMSSRRALWFLVAIGLSFTALPWLLSRLISPIYIDRYTIPAVAAVALLLAWSLRMLPAWGRALASAVLLLFTVHAFYLYHTGLDKDPWREAANEVAKRVRAGDRVLLVKHYTRDAFGYYFTPPPGVWVISPRTTDAIPSGLDDAERILLVKSYMDRPTSYEEALLDHIFRERVMVDHVRIADGVRRNRWSPSIQDITVTVYERDWALVQE